MALNKNRNLLFWGITLLFPVLVFFIIEVGLRIGGYNEELQDLFIEMPSKPDYLVTNPAFVSRYFPNFVPQLAPAPFFKNKPDSTFRVFVFGGSSTQGFPYTFYGSFSSRIEQKLMMETQGLNIEVINLGMTAVNSYVIWDLSHRVEDYEPDAVIIYAGHNEFYGSFGVGSSQFGAGKLVRLKRLTISLKNLRLYQFFENLLKSEDKNSENRTLMARVVSESDIKLNDDVYEAGIHQFKKNLTDAVSGFTNKEIPVYIGTIASNLKDQAPLGEDAESNASFKKAQKEFAQGDLEIAKAEFLKAKELDEIRFRGPEDINKVIKTVSTELNLELIDIQEASYDSSSSGIPDNTFFADHLHPNWRGNQIIGELFFERIKEKQLGDYFLPNKLSVRPKLNQFEKTFSETPVYRLTSGYPFKKGVSPEQEQANFQKQLNIFYKKSYVDSIAASAWRYQRQAYLAITDVINFQNTIDDQQGISDHYLSLAQWQIFNDNLLKKGVDKSVNNRGLDSNTALLLHLILNKQKREDAYFANALSAIYLLNQDLDRAGYWLKESEEIEPNSKELAYNYARFHVLNGDTTKARIYYDRYIKLTEGN